MARVDSVCLACFYGVRWQGLSSIAVCVRGCSTFSLVVNNQIIVLWEKDLWNRPAAGTSAAAAGEFRYVLCSRGLLIAVDLLSGNGVV